VEAKVKVETRRVKLRAVRRHHLIIRFANRVIENRYYHTRLFVNDGFNAQLPGTVQ
jgi:hypothetical protein